MNYSNYLIAARHFCREFADNMKAIFQKGAEQYVQKNRSVYQERRRRAYRGKSCVHGGEVPVQSPQLSQNEHRESVPNDRHAFGRVLIEIPPEQNPGGTYYIRYVVLYR